MNELSFEELYPGGVQCGVVLCCAVLCGIVRCNVIYAVEGLGKPGRGSHYIYRRFFCSSAELEIAPTMVHFCMQFVLTTAQSPNTRTTTTTGGNLELTSQTQTPPPPQQVGTRVLAPRNPDPQSSLSCSLACIRLLWRGLGL